MKKLGIEEVCLKGEWILQGTTMESDEVGIRIRWLIENDLRYIGSDETGWRKLYIDPHDDRYWGLSFPEGYLQGGGPPMLNHLPGAVAKEKFNL